MTKFIVLSTQRSGSTWLVELLNSHPQAVVYSELFLAGGRGKPLRGARDRDLWETYRAELSSDDADPERKQFIPRYLDDVFDHPKAEAVGFKLMYGQAGAYPEVVAYLRNCQASVVHLIRRNFLDIIISKNAAVARNKFMADAGEPIEDVRMRLNVPELLTRLETQEREVSVGRDLFAGADQPYLEVYYEDLLDDASLVENVLRFLHLKPPDRALSSRLAKMNTASHSAMVENYELVRRTLSGTRFEGLLR